MWSPRFVVWGGGIGKLGGIGRRTEHRGYGPTFINFPSRARSRPFCVNSHSWSTDAPSRGPSGVGQFVVEQRRGPPSALPVDILPVDITKMNYDIIFYSYT